MNIKTALLELAESTSKDHTDLPATISLAVERIEQLEKEGGDLRERNLYLENQNDTMRALLSIESLEAEHSDDLAVAMFAMKMREKLAKKRQEGRSGWDDKDQCSQEFLNRLLCEHISKGDPVDVANLAMMLSIRGERTSLVEHDAEVMKAAWMDGVIYVNHSAKDRSILFEEAERYSTEKLCQLHKKSQSNCDLECGAYGTYCKCKDQSSQEYE